MSVKTEELCVMATSGRAKHEQRTGNSISSCLQLYTMVFCSTACSIRVAIATLDGYVVVLTNSAVSSSHVKLLILIVIPCYYDNHFTL